MGTLKPTVSLRPGTLTKHLHLDKNFAHGVDTLSGDEDVSAKLDQTGTDRSAIVIIALLISVLFTSLLDFSRLLCVHVYCLLLVLFIVPAVVLSVVVFKLSTCLYSISLMLLLLGQRRMKDKKGEKLG